MIKIYSMDTCPDCIDIKRQVENNPSYQIIEIGQHVRNLKEFLRLRDTCSVFVLVLGVGYIGIPCFVLDDGRVTLVPEEAGLMAQLASEAESCSLDGSGC